ncbi:tetraacyldisaccharide 4'-kinase [Wenzhouxiangella sp. XN24]|uniref:tetraacyldisaccharide 4'-kinase n=1 Tax=Wenzhouxiangella sp. XN24 TaxID=2713569 RepID=UPI0013EC25F3|nr:tetraacyldisaccharide 4'-kinase [Wenzhouxiangella sp. XN24]NGX16718.1 tetraacyldisaccharide 4'-kinase [Wenzhouxiangella sp. XN24]
MSAWRERLTGAWYDPEAGPPAWARLLEPFYRLVVRTRRGLYRRGFLRSGHPGVPVVIVGNLTVGGAGKTPLVILVAQLLVELGRRPALVSRGYGGAEPRHPHRVREHDDPAFTGDEPLLLANATACPVWICRDRLAAARAAAAGGADVIVADDGLQHYRLRRDFEIVVVDGARGLGNGRCLPAGPLREPPARLGEADLVVCNGEGHCPPGAVRMSLVGEEAVRIDASARQPLAAFAPGPVHGIAGIGHPQRFFDFLARHGVEVVPHPLPDHAHVPEGLLAPQDGLPVLMTSKDAARCARTPASAACWEVPVTADLGADAPRLRQALARRLGMREA